MGIDPGKLNQIPTKSLRAACPKDNILFLLYPDTGAEVLNTCIYLNFTDLRFRELCFFAIISKTNPKISHELKHTK